MKRILLAALLSITAFAQQPVRQGQITQVSGNGSALVTTTGAQTANDCVKIDAGGNHVAAGSGCISGGAPSGAAGQYQIQSSTGTFGAAGTVYAMSQLGFVGDGTTDNSAAMTAALATLSNAHGGALFCDTPGTYKFLSQITLPNYDATTPAHHYPFRIYGPAAQFPWVNSALKVGCIFDLRYSGTNGGQIFGSGMGYLEVDHLTLNAPVSPTTTWATTGASLTSIVVSSNVATVTTAAANTLVLGNYIQVLGSSTANLNGTYQITAITDSTHFTFSTIATTVPNATYNNAGMTVNYTTPMVYLTNTQGNFHDLYILGDTSLGLATNNQDVFVLSGTSVTLDNSPNSYFAGYGSIFHDISLDYIRRAVYVRAGAQQIPFSNFFLNPTTTGSNDVQAGFGTSGGAAFEESVSGGFNAYYNDIPAGQYLYGFLFQSTSTGQSSITNALGGDHCCAGKSMYRLNSSNNVVIGAATYGIASGSGQANLVALSGSGPATPAQFFACCSIGSQAAIGNATTNMVVGNVGTNYPALYSNAVTPSGTNYGFATGSAGDTYLNGTSDVYFGIANSLKGHLTSTGLAMTLPISTAKVVTSALPTCTATTGTPWRGTVSDASSPAVGSALTGGGSTFANVHCSLTSGAYIVDGL